MRHHILSGFLSCALLTVLVALPPSATLMLSRGVVAQAKTKLPWLDPSDPYLVYYESWGKLKPSDIDKIRAHFKLLVVSRGITKEDIAQLKADDGKPKPLVFGYISIGEDNLKAEWGGPPYKGDGSGPSCSTGKQCKGKSKSKGKDKDKDKTEGVASFYLDEYIQKKAKKKDWKIGHDGIPDRNSNDPSSGSLFVNTGDPEWRQTVKDEAKRLINDVGCDGLFLDTLDMADNEAYKWTRPAMLTLISELNEVTPNIIVNRGLFFFDVPVGSTPQQIADYNKQLADYKSHIWGVMFENFYTTLKDQDKKDKWKGAAHEKESQDWNDAYIARLDGVQVFALDYVNCKQSDFQKLSDMQRAKVAPLKWRNYISSWLLNEIRYDFKCQ